MKRVIQIAWIGVIIFALIYAAWYMYQGELYFFTDVAGEFLLLKEISEKGIILIGRHSSGGLFHGPLWAYINYPAYLVGKGSPLVVGWFWISLVAFFTIVNYFVAKKLFNNEVVGMIFAALYSLYWVGLTKVFLHPYSAIFIFPLYFYLFVKYVETIKFKYLAWHIILAGLLIQSDLGIGIPFTILSGLAVLYIVIKQKKPLHLCAFLLLGIVLINFVIFNLRHQFIYLHYTARFLGSTASASPFIFIMNKLKWMWVSIDLARNVPENINFCIMISLFVFMILQIKKNRYRLIYVSYIYFYIGFFILSFINNGPIMQWYVLPLYVLTLLMLASFATVKKGYWIAIAFLIVIISINMRFAYQDTQTVQAFSNSNEDSWKSLNIITSKVFSGKEKEFGYFIYSPDALGYEPKYAMHYQEKIHPNKKAYYFKKMPITYLIIVPPPKNNPYMKHEWWRENQVHISGKPDDSISFPNEYIIEKYYLSPEEQKIPWSSDIDTGFHFR